MFPHKSPQTSPDVQCEKSTSGTFALTPSSLPTTVDSPQHLHQKWKAFYCELFPLYCHFRLPQPLRYFHNEQRDLKALAHLLHRLQRFSLLEHSPDHAAIRSSLALTLHSFKLKLMDRFTRAYLKRKFDQMNACVEAMERIFDPGNFQCADESWLRECVERFVDATPLFFDFLPLLREDLLLATNQHTRMLLALQRPFEQLRQMLAPWILHDVIVAFAPARCGKVQEMLVCQICTHLYHEQLIPFLTAARELSSRGFLYCRIFLKLVALVHSESRKLVDSLREISLPLKLISSPAPASVGLLDPGAASKPESSGPTSPSSPSQVKIQLLEPNTEVAKSLDRQIFKLLADLMAGVVEMELTHLKLTYESELNSWKLKYEQRVKNRHLSPKSGDGGASGGDGRDGKAAAEKWGMSMMLDVTEDVRELKSRVVVCENETQKLTHPRI